MLIYTPLGFVWVYYAIKARAFWFFTPSNPTLEFAGFEGETKKEMYDQLPKKYYPKTLYFTHDKDVDELIAEVSSNGFTYPVIAKPEVGMQGILVRKLKNEQQLKDYHIHIPVNYLVQDYVDLPLEFSVFHIRYPGQEKGKVTGFILKEYIEVTGDGTSTLLQLIQHHPKAMFREEEMRHLHEENLENIYPAEQKYMLSFTGNHNRGAKFINLHQQIDQRLCDVFDKISNEAGQFYFGRYDLKCTSIEDLKQGKNISILEYNGAGAEPNHIYDCGMSYWNALKEVARHWDDLYRIGKINNRNGVPYWSFFRGKKQMDKSRRFFTMLRKYDMEY